MSKRVGGRVILLAIAVIIVLLMLKGTVLRDVSSPSMEGVLRDACAPVQKIFMAVGNWGKGALTFPLSLLAASRHNRELTEKVSGLEGEVRELEEFRLENERLKEMLDYKSSVVSSTYSLMTVAAVISRDPGNWFDTINLGKGSRQGIRINMTVVVPEGLVGRVIKVSENTAQVLLITDPRSAVSGLIQQTRSPGLVEGAGGGAGGLRMINIPYDAVIRPGQVVVTAGVGSLFPKGLPVGQIKSSGRDPSGLFYTAVIRPFVDFNRLEEVCVIQRTSS
ncbi:MAG: rod shape-determining protein MreC [Eubacteriales bacterium]